MTSTIHKTLCDRHAREVAAYADFWTDDAEFEGRWASDQERFDQLRRRVTDVRAQCSGLLAGCTG